jgi:hypothetical protein
VSSGTVATSLSLVTPALTQAQVADATKRLQQHGLVAKEKATATNSYEEWQRLGPRSDGVRVLGVAAS